jgi:LmbE family N-acetylglucosaminyl deacetylase
MDMNESLRLMAILAHPDDESLGFGGTFAKYAAEGVHMALVVATRGERGWTGDPDANPGRTALGEIREAELRAAATALGIERLTFLDQIDGELAQAASDQLLARIVAEIRAFRPQVVVTFGPDGAYGHPDHIAISQLATAAVMLAADPEYPVIGDVEPVQVRKLYYRIWTKPEELAFRSVFGDIAIEVDGVRRGLIVWPEWAVSTRFDTADYWSQVQSAVLFHQSQIGSVSRLTDLETAVLRTLWGTQQFYRAMSTVAVSYQLEVDLFAGLRNPTTATGLLEQMEPLINRDGAKTRA